MNDKQKRFVAEYLIDLNVSAATIRAGYSPTYTELSQVKAVREGIEKANAERSKRTGITKERIIRELARIAFANPSDIINLDGSLKTNVSEDDFAAIASFNVKIITTKDGKSFKYKINLFNKSSALALLGKHFGMFKDKIESLGDFGVTIINDIPKDDDKSV